MSDNLILSICIPLHNRSEVVSKCIEKILTINDGRYDIKVSDTSDFGIDLMAFLNQKHEQCPPKVKIHVADSSTPPMLNWKLALDNADGIFCMHLNDRDILLQENLPQLLDFLEKHKDCNGGVCKSIQTDTTAKIYESDDALINIPYFATHPTGIIFNTQQYRKLGNLSKIFSKEYGIHPHDIVLAKLSQNGKLFLYTGNIWQYAHPQFYKNNLSGFVKKNSENFFEPQSRIFELEQNIKELQTLSFSDEVKKMKIKQMFRTYLGLATNGYFYVVESEHESAHYGIEREKYSLMKKYHFSMNVLDMFDKQFHFSEEEKKQYKKWLIKTIAIPIIAQYTSKINNKVIRNFLRKMRIKRDASDNALLR